jgi:hypothetical protein
MECADARRLMAHALEAAERPADADALFAHLDCCVRCRAEAEAQLEVRAALTSRPADDPAADFLNRLLARLAALRSRPPRRGQKNT